PLPAPVVIVGPKLSLPLKPNAFTVVRIKTG
ncbi:hypothetical protein FHS84_001638, partial [Rhizomicrobium electricum]|nr:hypothetical protein [Rhizomicrobium electricum]NIJ48276.1 hypothetical protein [Rhizomicrobium electricum]